MGSPEPPFVPWVPGGKQSPAPIMDDEEMIVESKVTKVARVFAIIRDALIILAMAALIYFAGSILSAVKDATTPDGVSGQPDVTDCASPATDLWGTFCPTTPGGGGG